MKTCKDYKPFLMGLMDNELTPEEASDVNQHLIHCSKCREEYDQIRETTGKIGGISFIEPQDEVLKNLWKMPYSHFTRNAGLFLVLGSYVALIIYALFQLLTEDKAPVFPKIAIAALVIGFIILLGSMIRERLHTYQSDPYKEVKR
ncbi:MAG: hypothetical protein A2161_19685 [Candidatus Schekmanbacteria bacterium RBG_13_48_7]|uniref:Putative zinc-finger domain-containing protein n=1 Tax=Candidatus Schekmanbacteria bacterium RBG_13_48_7 TaxID=1817878 RepID=A0A1F7RKJ8_9BACT|nr:MAG: hypothetical protein A2161_19685 [Candidatus Schekmanbacteria bacterium RBG_13_48_7]